jgi:hypothetical protein
MSTEQKRAALMGAYPSGVAWQARVKVMSEKQVHVIYVRLLNANQL